MRAASEVMLELATSGLDARQLALVMELSAAVAGEGKADPVAEKRRKYDRERKRKLSAKSTGNPPESAETSPPNDNSNPPTATTSDEVVVAARARSAPMRDLPADWRPNLTPAAQRVVDGWPPGKLEREVGAFRDHAADKGRKSKDWQAAFRKWIENADKWMPRNDRPTASNDTITNPMVRAVARAQAARAGPGGG